MVGSELFCSSERLGQGGEADGQGGENYGDLGHQSNEEGDDEHEGEAEDSDEDHADNGDGQQYEADQNLEGYDEYQMQFSNRESSRPGELDPDPIYKTQIRNGGRNIARGPDRLKDTFLQGSNRTDISSLGRLDPSSAYQEYVK